MVKRKPKKNSWHQLKDEKCPKCNNTLMNDLFTEGKSGCVCGFNLEKEVKELLVKRDSDE